jgi:hypothetical protein
MPSRLAPDDIVDRLKRCLAWRKLTADVDAALRDAIKEIERLRAEAAEAAASGTRSNRLRNDLVKRNAQHVTHPARLISIIKRIRRNAISLSADLQNYMMPVRGRLDGHIALKLGSAACCMCTAHSIPPGHKQAMPS